MALQSLHRLVVAATVLLAFGIALVAYRRYALTGEASRMWMAVVAGGVALGLVAHLAFKQARLLRLARARTPWPLAGGR